MSASPKLAADEFARVAAIRQTVHELMPEAVPFIQDLVREGLLQGWRNVVWAGTAEAGEERHQRLFAPRTLTYQQFTQLGQKENQKWTTSTG